MLAVVDPRSRRLSTLRHLSRFLVSTQVIDEDFTTGIENQTMIKIEKFVSLADHPSVKEFKSYLESEKISANTIKNYLSDTRHFLNWLSQNTN